MQALVVVAAHKYLAFHTLSDGNQEKRNGKEELLYDELIVKTMDLKSIEAFREN